MVIYFVVFISFIQIISSIFPPTLPVTFFSSYEIVFQHSNTTLTVSGFIAEDDSNKLFTTNQTAPSGVTVEEIFNQHQYQYYDGTSQCECINTTYKDANLPYFSFLKNLVLYQQTKTDNIWKVPSYLPTLYLVSFKRAAPNIPESIIIKDESYPSNTTFIGFTASQPDSKLFMLPDFCTKTPCRNVPKKSSMVLSKFM